MCRKVDWVGELKPPDCVRPMTSTSWRREVGQMDGKIPDWEIYTISLFYLVFNQNYQF